MNRINAIKPARTVFIGLCTVFLALLLLNSCEEVLTNSWGKGLARDPDKVSVSPSNVNELLKSARGNPELSRAILSKIKGQVKNASPGDRAKLQLAAITAAKQAAGIDTLVLGKLGALTGGDLEDDAVEKILGDILPDAKKNGISGVSKDLAEILGAPGSIASTANGPIFVSKPFTDAVTEPELTMVVLTLILGKAVDAGGDMNAYLSQWGATKRVDSTTGLDPDEIVLAAAVNLMSSRFPNSDLTRQLNSVLK